MDERNRSLWNRYWTGYVPSRGATTLTHVLDQIKLEYLRPILPARGLLLEVGCGSGRLSCALALLGYRTVCLDFSPAALAAAQGAYRVAGAGGSFVAGEALDLPFASAAFDVVMSTGLLEHFADPLPIVLEMVRVLRPGGVFYSDIVPRKFSLFRAFDWFKGFRGRLHPKQENACEEMFERSFSGREICNLLRRAGLARPQAFAAGVIPPYVPLLYRIRWFRLAEVRIVEWTQSFWKALDGTWLAEWLGFYYFSWATKP